MKSVGFSCSICAISLLGFCLIGGCHQRTPVRQHPDEVDSVNNALVFNNITNVRVAQDRKQGVMTLTGTVSTPDQKEQASRIASTNAGDYTITNDVRVKAAATQAKTSSHSGTKDK